MDFDNSMYGHTVTVVADAISADNIMDYVTKVYKIYPEAELPVYGTDRAACFDLKACLVDGNIVKAWDGYNEPIRSTVWNGTIDIKPGDRALVPTGLIFDLNPGFNMRIHPRSGLAVKNGITLINSEGVIDEDYVHETFISLYNTSKVPFTIKHGDRIAQGEIYQTAPKSYFKVRDTAPEPKGNRTGGVGSTGV